MNDFSLELTPDIRDANLKWSNKLQGIQENKSRERLAGDITQSTLCDDFGKLYAQNYFSEQDKENVKAIVEQVIATYRTKIRNLDWMGDATKEAAVKKLDQMTIKVGYPDKWPEYLDHAAIKGKAEGGSLVNNTISVQKAIQEHDLAQMAGAVDKTVWSMTPQTVNAYYNATANEIVFPAAILQAPFYDDKVSYESNLGGIGFIIAHEISHAFDDAGSKYDGKQTLNVCCS